MIFHQRCTCIYEAVSGGSCSSHKTPHKGPRGLPVSIARGATGVLGPWLQWLHDSPQLTILVSAEAILSAENSGKPLGGRRGGGSAREPRWGAHSASQTP